MRDEQCSLYRGRLSKGIVVCRCCCEGVQAGCLFLLGLVCLGWVENEERERYVGVGGSWDESGCAS